MKGILSMLAYCGLECSTCPIHLATVEADLASQHMMRVDIARQCTEVYGMSMEPEEVTDCDGCVSPSGRLFSGCAKCEIRRCASARNFPTCASCPEYTCKTLRRHFTMDPSAFHRLEQLHKTGGNG